MTDTLAALEQAIQAHIADAFEGSLVDSWIIVTHSQQVERHDLSNYRIVTPESQPIHVDRGLLDIGEQIAVDSWDNAWDEDDDD